MRLGPVLLLLEEESPLQLCRTRPSMLSTISVSDSTHFSFAGKETLQVDG